MTTTFIKPRWQKQEIEGLPQLPETQALLCVALTIVVMAYSGFFGMIPILMFYAFWLPRILYKGRFTLKPTKDIWLLILLPAFCIFTILWSDFRSITLRAALEYASMITCTIIAARITKLETFIKGLAIGASLTLIITLSRGGYALDYFTGQYVFVGLLGSKNQVGFIAEIAIYASILLFFVTQRKSEKLIFSLFPFMLGMASLLLSHSATSLASLLATLLAVYAAHFLSKFPPSARKLAFTFGLFFALTFLALVFYMGWEEVGYSALGKNSSLTGRTHIWEEGIKYGMENPFFGHGFYAFWVPGQPGAEKLWYEFGMYGRNGFHFHDVFIHSFVDAGIFGALLITAVLVLNFIWSLRYIIKNGMDLKAFYCLGISVMLFVRAFVEVDIWGAFGVGIFLVASICPYLAKHSYAQQIAKKIPQASSNTLVRFSKI